MFFKSQIGDYLCDLKMGENYLSIKATFKNPQYKKRIKTSHIKMCKQNMRKCNLGKYL